MKLYAPYYYRDFVCIADRCRHSCCIGWEIDVDEETLLRYDGLSSGYGRVISDSIDRAETPHFRLSAGERCPHLDERGLCRIITALGEGYLCEICREHPRFYHDTVHGKEVGIGMACEEAARIILASDAYGRWYEVGEIAGEASDAPFDACLQRERIYQILADRSVPYRERLERIQQGCGVSVCDVPDDAWRESIASLEYLNDAHREWFSCYSSELSTLQSAEKLLERALAYFIFRYASDAYDEEEFRTSIGFAFFCERLLASLVKTRKEPVEELARVLSEEIEYSEENVERLKEMLWL